MTTSLAASTYSNCKGEIHLFAGLCIDAEGMSHPGCTEATCVRYLAWIADSRRYHRRRLRATRGRRDRHFKAGRAFGGGETGHGIDSGAKRQEPECPEGVTAMQREE
eukprot:jgi/Tetstr1/454521/TSEL_041419.t1